MEITHFDVKVVPFFTATDPETGEFRSIPGPLWMVYIVVDIGGKLYEWADLYKEPLTVAQFEEIWATAKAALLRAREGEGGAE